MSRRLLSAACVLVSTTVVVVAQSPGYDPAWNKPATPHKVIDNIYFVGTTELASFLITTAAGHILVDSGFEETVPLIRNSIRALGFKYEDIRVLLNTQAHFDHAAGLRTYAAEGVTIVTHEVNRPYFERAALNSWTLDPDRLAKSKKKPVFQTMGDNMVLTDGTRSVELYQITGNSHHDGIIMAYLRKEKILIEADVFTPLPEGAEPPKTPNPLASSLEANVRRLNLDVERIVPIHGRIVRYSELLAVAGKKPPPAKQ